MASPVENYSRAWLAGTDPRRYALVRIGFALVVLLQVIHLLPYSAVLLSDSGVLPGYGPRPNSPGPYFSLFWLFHTPALALLGLCLAAAAAVLLAVGIQARICAIFLWWFCLSVVQRIPDATAGWDMILSNFALLIAIGPLAAEWGPRRLASEWRSTLNPPAVPRYGLLLMQLQVFVIYWQTAIGKLIDPFWSKGEFLSYFMLSHHSRFPGPWAASSEGFLSTGTYAVLAIELFLPLMLWVRGLRAWGLIAGIGLHLSIAVLGAKIEMFSVVMIFTYLAFLSPWDRPGPGGERDVEG